MINAPQALTTRARSWIGAGFAAALVVTVSIPVINAATAAPDGPEAIAPAALALSGAQQLLASEPQRVHEAAGDAFVAAAPVQEGGLQYVSYTRTHQGLPVSGGDFVVVTDQHGNPLSTSVAQAEALTLADVTPSISTARAAAVARRQVTRASSASTPVLSIIAGRGGRLAYEVVVAGLQQTSSGQAPTRQHVFVNAESGKVIADAGYDEVRDAVGHGNHGRAVQITTSGSGAPFSMSDPTRPGLRCGGQDGGTYTKITNTWGNSSGNDLETACVDALYAVQREWDMLRDWAGRDGINGTGGGYPAHVGLKVTNAYWDGTATRFGRNSTNTKQVTSLDVVGHEFGHAIFQTTPGGPGGGNEAGGLNESTGDIFGSLTEHYANNPNDRPDYDIGEMVNLVGSGAIRHMNQPSRKRGHPDCYTAAITTTKVHAGAGPQNHWFYLLAEGSKPTNGKPASATCNKTTLTGIGIQKAAKIFMGTLNRKTSGWTHAKARLASVQAAVQLFPTSTRECAAVKAAWSAVSVGVKSGEPACPTAMPTPAGTTKAPSASPTPTVAASPPPNINATNVKAHLTQLQSFAKANGGHRRSGGGGYTASLNYADQKLRAAGYTTTRQICTSGCTSGSVNLIAEWPGGNADKVYMFGAHLDSVQAGPGINDNGSGSAGILEIALQLAARNPTMLNKVRFGWWADEEQGMKGSKFYVASLSAAERAKIKVYYNFDMIGSPNGGYFVNNIGTTAAAHLKAFYTGLGVAAAENTEGVHRSDDASFRNAGIATTGVASGAAAKKTATQARKWGGTAGRAFDVCYHRACDTTANINTTILDRAADAIAAAMWKNAVGTGTASPTVALPTTTAPVTTLSATTAADCTGYQYRFTASLTSGASAYQPNNSYYYANNHGAHAACLAGPPSTDYDLYLQKWSGSAWTNVASSTGAVRSKGTTYSGTAGYYRYRIHAASGSGTYALGYHRPA